MRAQILNIFLFAVKFTNLILPEVIIPLWIYIFLGKRILNLDSNCTQTILTLIYFHILFKNSHTLGPELLTLFSCASCKYSIHVAVVYWSRVGAFCHRKKGLFKNKVISLLVKDCEKQNKKDPQKSIVVVVALLAAQWDVQWQLQPKFNPPQKRVTHACTNIHRRGLQRQIWWRHWAISSGPFLIIPLKLAKTNRKKIEAFF